MPNVPRAMRAERSPVRFATPYLEVETRSVSSLERAIRREPAQASHAAIRTSGRTAISPRLSQPGTLAILARGLKREREPRENDQLRRDELDHPTRRAG